jgi:hypothetical protein
MITCYNNEIIPYKNNLQDIPNNLTHSQFGEYFNQEIKENVLSTSLTHLTFGRNFNEKIFFPKSLIELGFYNNCSIKDNIPDFIENIVIIFYNNGKITNLPISIKKIKVNDMSQIGLIEKIPFGCIIEQL